MSIDTQTKILQDFHKSLIQFIDVLIGIIPDCGEFVAIRLFITDRIPITEIMKYFINIIIPMEDLIKKRSDTIIMDNLIFKQIDPKGISNA